MSIPAGWEVMSLGGLMDSELFTDGDWIESKDQDPGGGIRLIQLADIGEGFFRDRSSRFVNQGTVERLNCTLLAAGDVLVARMPDPLGRACLVPSTLGMPGITAVDVCILRPDASRIHARWLMWAINTPEARSQIAALQTGTTRKRISRKNLATVRLPVPPLPEQERIVKAIEEQFSRLDAAERSISTVLRKSARFRSAALYQLMQGWPTTLLEDVVAQRPHALKAGPFGSALKKSFYVQSGFKVYGQEQVLRGDPEYGDYFIDEERFESLRSCAVAARDVLISLVGTIGRTLILPEGIRPGIINPRLVKVSLDESRMLPEFFCLALASPTMRHQLGIEAHGGTMDILNLSLLKQLRFPLPSVNQQAAIVDEMAHVDEGIRVFAGGAELASRRCVALRRTILRDAFAGKLAHQGETTPSGKVTA